jgi:HK97 family phage portal protein
VTAVLLTERTKSVLAERQREARRSAPPSVETGRHVVRYRADSGAMVTRGTGDFVGNPNMVGVQAGWTIVKGDTPSQMQQNGINARLIGYERNAVFNACVRIVDDLVAAVPLEVYKKVPPSNGKHRYTGDDVVLMPESPAQKVLDTPWFSLSPFRMRRLFCDHFSVYGNWFAAMIREGEDVRQAIGDQFTVDGAPKGAVGILDGNAMQGLPTMLRPVHPERLLYVYLDAITEEPILYDWRDRYGYRHRTPAVNMLHCADSTCTDWIFGYPRAAAALLDVGTDNEASAYVRQVLHNDGTAGTLIMLEELISDEEAQRIKERYYQRNVERGQRGRTAFMSGVKDVKVIGWPMKEMEFPNLRMVAREDICAAFGVDPRMVGIGSATGSKEGGLSGKQFLEARFRLIQQTVLPIMRMIEAYMDTWFMPEFGAQMYCRFSREALSALTEDETETWTRTTAAFAAGLITREEGRSYVGQPDEAEPTDTWFVPALGQLVPVANEFDAFHDAAQARENALTAPPPEQQSGAGTGEGDQGKPPRGTGKQQPKVSDEEDTKNAGAGGAGAADTSGKPTAQVPASKRQRLLGPGVITSTPGSESGGEVLQPLQQVGRVGALLRYITTPIVRGKTVLSPLHRKAAWEIAEAKAQAHEPKMQRMCTLQFEADSAECDRAIRASVTRAVGVPESDYNAAIQDVAQLFARNDGPRTTAWRDAMTPLIRDAMSAGAQDLSDAVGVSWNLQNPHVQTAITARAERLADYVGETTGALATEALRAAWQSGLSVHAAADLIRSTVFSDEMTADRAQRIARTESIGALNQGEHTAATLSGVVKQKEWLSQQDDRVRESHADLDGTTIDLNDTFDNGCAYPGDPSGDASEVINCRCTLLYHTADEPFSGDSEDDL